MIGGGGGEFRCAGINGFKQHIHAKGLAMAPHREFIAAGGPGKLTVAVAQLFKPQQGLSPQLIESFAA